MSRGYLICKMNFFLPLLSEGQFGNKLKTGDVVTHCQLHLETRKSISGDLNSCYNNNLVLGSFFWHVLQQEINHISLKSRALDSISILKTYWVVVRKHARGEWGQLIYWLMIWGNHQVTWIEFREYKWHHLCFLNPILCLVTSTYFEFDGSLNNCPLTFWMSSHQQNPVIWL